MNWQRAVPLGASSEFQITWPDDVGRVWWRIIMQNNGKPKPCEERLLTQKPVLEALTVPDVYFDHVKRETVFSYEVDVILLFQDTTSVLLHGKWFGTDMTWERFEEMADDECDGNCGNCKDNDNDEPQEHGRLNL